jgi:hypothetical protein
MRMPMQQLGFDTSVDVTDARNRYLPFQRRT